MDTNLENFIDVPKLLLTILFILPGFLAEEELREKFPFKRSTTFERTVYSIYYSIIIHFLLLSTLVLYFSIKSGLLPIVRQPYVETIYAIKSLPSLLFYCTLAIIAGQLYGRFFLVSYYERSKKTKAFFPPWSRTFPNDKITFAKIKLKDGTVYSGQIKYIPSDYDLLSSPNKDIFIVLPSVLENGRWKELKRADGILLNTQDILSLELAFRDVKDASG